MASLTRTTMAESPGAACKACETVRTILRIKEELAAAIKDHVASV